MDHLIGGIVHQNIQPPKFLQRSVNHFNAVPLVPNIARQPQRAAPSAFHLLDGSHGVLLLAGQIADGNIGALARVCNRHRLAYPAVRSGN
jgi:hypothetical protein